MALTMINAVFHHPSGLWLQDRLKSLQSNTLNIEIVPDAEGRELANAMAKADVLLHVLHPVTEEMLAAAPKLKLIQKIGVGLDSVDLDAAKARGIAVCNMPGTNTQAVVELTFGLMLSVLRSIPKLDHRLSEYGDWELSPSAQGQFGEIAGKVVGLVGHGHVARRLAIVLDALGAEVLISKRTALRSEASNYVTKTELLERSDILSLHIPETPETRNWLDAGAIARMKPGAIVINTARGGLVDEAALENALRSGHVSGAGLDVFACEPLPARASILSAPNVVAVPHVAWLTRETLDRSLAAVSENMHLLVNGHQLNNRHV